MDKAACPRDKITFRFQWSGLPMSLPAGRQGWGNHGPLRSGAGGIIADVSSRCDGNMSLTYGDTARSLENRGAFLAPLGIDHRSLVCGNQVHGARVVCVSAKDRGKGALSPAAAFTDTDALITACRGMPIAVFTADCLPVFLYDPRHHAAGIVHAGRRGTQAEIAPLALRAMRDHFGTSPVEVYAAFGPCIRDCCYEVGGECAAGFSSGARSRSGRYFLDLVEINRGQLTGAGVGADHIYDCGICTSCPAAETFSYRRDGPGTGRIISVIMLE